MALRKTFLFENCNTGVEDLTDPQGKSVGKVFIIVDNDTGDVYKCPMIEGVAKKNGGMLMGVNRVTVSSEEDLRKLIGGRRN